MTILPLINDFFLLIKKNNNIATYSHNCFLSFTVFFFILNKTRISSVNYIGTCSCIQIALYTLSLAQIIKVNFIIFLLKHFMFNWFSRTTTKWNPCCNQISIIPNLVSYTIGFDNKMNCQHNPFNQLQSNTVGIINN